VGVRCVVFDVDDTLYLERDYVRSGFEAIGPLAESASGIRGFAPALWALFEAGLRRTTFNEVFSRAGVKPSPGLIDELIRRYRSHAPAISLLPDARACLERLKGRARMAAITDGPAESQRAKAEALGLSGWMNPIVLTSELGPGLGKPDPAAYLRVESATGCSGNACAYVADNPSKDFTAPRSLGWRTLRIRRPLGLHFELPHGGDVDSVVPDMSTVPEWLGLD
jgi:putative hydrolase of the HAD superfamily